MSSVKDVRSLFPSMWPKRIWGGTALVPTLGNKGTRRAVQWLCPLISAVRARGVERFSDSQTLI